MVATLEALDDSALPALIAHTTEAADGKRGILNRLGVIENPAEDLVVPGGAHREVIANSPVLGTGIEPPGALELEDRFLTIGKHRGEGKPVLARVVGFGEDNRAYRARRAHREPPTAHREEADRFTDHSPSPERCTLYSFAGDR